MYLVSLYFDEKTNKRIQKMIHNVAEKSGNEYMVEYNVPPHITISAFETCEEELICEMLNESLSNICIGSVQWISIGVFKSSTVYIQPILNKYLHNLSNTIYKSIVTVKNTKISKYYQPFQWLPHATIAKQLSEDEMRAAFDVLQKSFSMFEGKVIRIELAKKKPFQVLASWELK